MKTRDKEKLKSNKKVVDNKSKKKKRKKKSKFRKTKLGKILFMFSDDKNSYSFSEVFSITLISLVLGAFACFCVFSIKFGGRNYLKLSKVLKEYLKEL